MDDRRLKKIQVYDDFLIHAILGFGPGEPRRYRIDGLPDGWEVFRCGYDVTKASFIVLVTHPSFEFIPYGSEPPFAEVNFSWIEPEAAPRGRQFI